MKTVTSIIACVLIGIFVQTFSFAECDTNAFIEAVNSAWVSTNYTLLEETLTNRVADCTNDILAKGLLYEYYDDICIDFYKARDAATEFITTTSNRMPSEVIHKRIPLESAISLVAMPIPTNFPADQSKTPEQMQFMHSEFQNTFPFLGSFQGLISRMEAIESGRVTNGYFNPFNRD